MKYAMIFLLLLVPFLLLNGCCALTQEGKHLVDFFMHVAKAGTCMSEFQNLAEKNVTSHELREKINECDGYIAEVEEDISEIDFNTGEKQFYLNYFSAIRTALTSTANLAEVNEAIENGSAAEEPLKYLTLVTETKQNITTALSKIKTEKTKNTALCEQTNCTAIINWLELLEKTSIDLESNMR